MEITRKKDGLGYDEIKMTKGSCVLSVCFGGNGDLYWDVLNLEDMDSKDEYFFINKNDGEIYDLFYRLYSNIVNHQIFQVNKIEESYCKTSDDVRKLYERARKDNEELSRHPYFNDLCNGKYIEWHSDNEPFEIGNRMIMFLDEETGEIAIEIKRVSRKYDFLNVCFTHSGSKYSPFDLAFYEHYKSLCEMDLGKSQSGEDHKKLIKE